MGASYSKNTSNCWCIFVAKSWYLGYIYHGAPGAHLVLHWILRQKPGLRQQAVKRSAGGR